MGKVEEIARVHYDGLLEEFDAVGIVPDLEYEHIEAVWKERIWEGNKSILVHTNKNGKVVGFLATYKEGTMLYVDKSYQRQGIGKKLLEDSGIESVWIMVGNEKAQKFYRSQGFEPVEDRVVRKSGLAIKELRWEKDAT